MRLGAPAWAIRVGLNRTSVGLKQDSARQKRDLRLRLNRTSVGLKRALITAPRAMLNPPQSNQRGIETRISRMAM